MKRVRIYSCFLDASTHLYKRLFPSVGWSVAQSFIYNISEISGGLFLEFFLWHDMTKRVMLFHSVPISFLNSSPLKEKMIFSIRFIHPMKNIVFMAFTAVFQEKFHAWYQMKGNDMVYHLRRAQA